jgi:hypothetical protein
MPATVASALDQLARCLEQTVRLLRGGPPHFGFFGRIQKDGRDRTEKPAVAGH